jgi:tetratricopeptide (TPR) repeat protein
VSVVDGYVQQAQSLIAVGRHAEAATQLQRAIAAEPEAAFPRSLLAACYVELGRQVDAVRMVESALAIDPESSLAHRVHSVALSATGRHKPALAAAQEAVRLSPSDADAVLALGEAQVENRLFDQARQSAERVMALEPASVFGHYLSARVALRQKRWKAAETACRAALRIDPRNWAVMNNLGVALQGQGRQKEAIEAFENAAKLNPKAEVARSNLFSQTRRYLIGVAVVLGFLLARALAAGNRFLSPAAIVLGVLITVAGIAALVAIRRRQLSPTVRTFYAVESRRRRLRTIAYFGLFYLGWIAMMALGLAGYVLLNTGAVLLPLIAAAIGWWYGWPRLWRRAIAPRLES